MTLITEDLNERPCWATPALSRCSNATKSVQSKCGKS